jgi:hypothetical protein
VLRRVGLLLAGRDDELRRVTDPLLVVHDDVVFVAAGLRGTIGLKNS